ncbi:hypothetical protein DUNSADRAFT_7951 [Dunaliella salina]|uniref:Encoded protein n=1 Tax=Dunaliella salina TaxID=3046 RepID=A0ABQ7H613_DUNSA|nr:hypothetical protein DUNSADRAFT_7951 [Dunaliella salina]|eukprot:KAF5842298.1 hypothetical protein DUNSADRAFT_7951 [Dunaliella salina]
MGAEQPPSPHAHNQQDSSPQQVYKNLHLDLGQGHESAGEEGEAGGTLPRLTSPLKTR